VSSSDVILSRVGSSQQLQADVTGTEFPRVRRLAPWEVRRAIELLSAPDLAPVIAFGAVGYGGVVEVPHYEERHVIVLLLDDAPVVFADGPRDSPHRYAGTALCMWDPKDPASAKWTVDNGITDLLYRIRNHLFREAWWRERREWLGPEAPHGAAA
jgi:hypothetical protein